MENLVLILWRHPFGTKSCVVSPSVSSKVTSVQMIGSRAEFIPSPTNSINRHKTEVISTGKMCSNNVLRPTTSA